MDLFDEVAHGDFEGESMFNLSEANLIKVRPQLAALADQKVCFFPTFSTVSGTYLLWAWWCVCVRNVPIMHWLWIKDMQPPCVLSHLLASFHVDTLSWGPHYGNI